MRTLAHAKVRAKPQGRLAQAEDGEVAARPAVALQQVTVEVQRSQPLNEDLVVVVGLPPRLVHLDGRVEVLGDRLGRHPADLDESFPTQDRSRTAPVGAVVPILAGADHLEEHALLMAADLVVLHRVLVVEIVRALDERDRLVVEIADGGVEGIGKGHVVSIEAEDQLPVRQAERRG